MIDTTNLTYGSVISSNVVSEEIELPRTDRDYGFKAMKLAEQIAKDLLRRDSIEYDIVIRQDSIRVLTPEEALHNNSIKRPKAAQNILRKALRKLGDIPVDTLSVEQIAELVESRRRVGMQVTLSDKLYYDIDRPQKTHRRPTPVV